MVEQLRLRRGIADACVLAALLEVERHRFVPESLQERAYGPYSLPIGAGQRTPHPDTVAVMAEALKLRGTERVLEIGTGCGYQTAILARLAREVCSLESLPQLAAAAADRLAALGVDNVRVQVRTDLRWPEPAQFDAIHVSAVAPEVPGILFAQLAPGGRLVLAVGRSPHQRLVLLVRRGEHVVSASLGVCRLEPLQGKSNVSHRPGQGQAETL